MRWRSLRQLNLHMRHPHPSISTRDARRHLSKHAILNNNNNNNNNNNIANILALPPIADGCAQRKVEVTAHVRTIRNQKRHSFVELGDGSTIHSLQAVLSPSQAASLGTGTAVTVSGRWLPSPPGKEQSYELHADEVKVIGVTDAEAYPIQKKYHSAEFLRTIPHLRLRTPINGLLARLRSDCDFHVATFFRARQFIRLQPPIITSSDCEGAGEVFSVHSAKVQDGEVESAGTVLKSEEEFFRSAKYLTVSSQLHLEAFVHEHQKVWTLSPTFRAEKSDTPRHLSEFYMLEAELRTESLQDVMDVVEDLIRSVAVNVRKSVVGQELLAVKYTANTGNDKSTFTRSEIIKSRWQGLERGLWPRVPYSKAIELLQAAVNAKEATFRYEPLWDAGLQLEHEKFLAAEIGQGSPVFITDYPKTLKPFYMPPSTLHYCGELKTPSTVSCFDLLLPAVCEVVGGSLREHRLEPLLQSMQQHGLQSHIQSKHSFEDQVVGEPSQGLGNFDWYVDLRRFGSVPHGGFGLGFDRLIGYLAGVDNIRDVVPWPRYYGKCEC